MWDFYTIKPVPSDLLTVEKLYLPTVNATRCGLNSLILLANCYLNKTSLTSRKNMSLLNCAPCMPLRLSCDCYATCFIHHQYAPYAAAGRCLVLRCVVAIERKSMFCV